MKKEIPLLLLLAFSAFSSGMPINTTLKPDPSFGSVVWFGWSLVACDFNGDGFEDIAVGSPRSDLVTDGDSLVVAGEGGHILRADSAF